MSAHPKVGVIRLSPNGAPRMSSDPLSRVVELSRRVDATSLDRQHIALAVPSSELTEAKREKRAKSGSALSDGSYPIFDAQSLRSAIRLVGRSTRHSSAEVKAHIIKRAKALGLENLLPEGWS